MKTIVTFGEVMGRLAPAGFLRFRQSLPGPLDLTFGGAEANVAASVAQLGGRARFVTALPQNAIADACVGVFTGLGVDTSCILRTKKGRLGLYFLESGANQRPSNVIYDRSHSSVSVTAAAEYDWEKIFADAVWLHWTGITPALSQTSAEAVLYASQEAKSRGLAVSCDLNFRKKLWNWESGTDPRALAEKTMRGILPHVDLVIANEEDAADVLGIHAAHTDVSSGKLAVGHYPDVAREIVRQFPNLSRVAITLRESLSASHNNWGAMLYDAATDTPHFAPLSDGKYDAYQIRNIVDRVGGGDSFGAGLIFALNTPELAEPARAIAFAVAASCLAHSVVGDINYSSRAEVESLMGGSASGRVVR
ncbi:MAG TPA: sugar kinase [Terrimicrobiaceae bacterium]|nr:sugar kinase [Terrimicrobiaceae bacterium]